MSASIALWVLLLGAPAPTLWVERDGGDLRLSADLGPMFDAALRRRLTSGLTTTLHARLVVEPFGGGAAIGDTWRHARVRWELWEERVTAIVDGPSGATTQVFPSVDAFVQVFARFSGVPVARGVTADARVYRLQVALEVNPLSAVEITRMRRWLAAPRAGSSLDPLSGSLLGSFVRLFDNIKPGVAERVLRATGPPFRADRLPFFRRSTPEVPDGPP